MCIDRVHFTLILLLAAGCAHKTNTDSHPPVTTQLTYDQIRSGVMSLADTYVTITVQSLDELGKRTKRPDVADWALRYKIATTSGAYTNAASPNPIIGLLDIVAYASLKRAGIEEHWIPTLLHEEGQGVLASFRRVEADAWELAARALTPSQVTELRELIEQWKKDNPDQYYVSHIRFTDFSDSRHQSDGPDRAKKPGSILSLLFIDPLASLDPMTREMQTYRNLSERAVYLAMRMPAILSWQLELAVAQAADNLQTKRFLDSVDLFNNNLKTFNDTSAALAATLQQYPRDLTKEREELVRQLIEGMTKQRQATFDALTAQRQGLSKDMETEHDRLNRLLAEARATLQDVRDTSTGVGASANNAVSQAEQSSGRLASKIFTYMLILLLVLIIVAPLMLLLYRYAASKLAIAHPDHHNATPAGLPIH